MMPAMFKTREGSVATVQGKPNRFGLTPYSVPERVYRLVPDKHGGLEWKWVDGETTVYVNAEGAAVVPPNPNFDSAQYARQQSVERDELAKRRTKDNWI